MQRLGIFIVTLFGLFVIAENAIVIGAQEYSDISLTDKERIERVVYDYLTREENREMLVKAGLISPLSVYWDSGLRIKSEDGRLKLKIGGRIMNDWGWFDEDSDIRTSIGDQVDGTEFRRARFYISGDIYKNISFKTDYGFASGGRPSFKDMYIRVNNIPYVGKFTIGHFKEPFGLEYMGSSKYITFMERGLNMAFNSERNTGFMLNNHFFDKRMTYALGMLRNADSFGDSEGGSSTEGGYSFTGRMTGLPYYEDDGKKLLHLGFSYSHQNAFEDTIRYSQRPEMHMADRFVDTGDFAAKHTNLFNPELAVVYGPFSFQTEYTYTNVGADFDDVTDTMPIGGIDFARTVDGGDNVDFSGWYVFGSYFITGEHRKYSTKSGTFGRVKPIQNFDMNGGWGAIELAVRYSELDLSDDVIDGGRLQDTTLGVNWHLNSNTRVMANYVFADAEIGGADDGNADLFGVRFQIDF